MTVHSYLRNRIGCLAAFTAAGLLGTAVVELDLRLSGAALQRGSLLYAWLLGLLCIALWLMYDYQREASFFRVLNQVNRSSSVDQMGVLPQPHTLEQRLFAEAWARLYAKLTSELSAERDRGRNNIQILSQWAHHMKTPVAVIDLELQKARQQDWPDAIITALDSIQEENARLDHSVQMLLNMVRLEDFTADFRIEPVDLVALVRQLVNEQKRTFITHQVYPRVETPDPADLPPALLVVQSDAKWLRFVLEQLISNAVKYASRPEGEGRVWFRFHYTEGTVVLEVADNGIGIAPEDLGRVFAPFFTGANGRAYPRSTGMGLYLAQQTCRRLGHQLDVTSTPGEGTRFFLRFAKTRTLFSDLRPSLTAK